MFQSKALASKGVFISTAILSAVLCSCSGYGSGSDENDEMRELLEELESSFNDSINSSSSSADKSSIDESSSSTNSILNDLQLDSRVTEVESTKDLGLCEDDSTVFVHETSSEYKCAYNHWFKLVRTVSETCTQDQEPLYKSAPYICKNGEWIEATQEDYDFGYCTEKAQGDTAKKDDTYYVCDNYTWKKATIEDIFGKCTDENPTQQVKSFNDELYVCRNYKWSEATDTDKKYGVCTKSLEGTCVPIFVEAVYMWTHIVCKDYQWGNTSDPDDFFGICTAEREGEEKKTFVNLGESTYKCKNNKWVMLSAVERENGECNEEKQGTMVSVDESPLANTTIIRHMMCDNGKWRYATPEEYYGPCTEDLQDTMYFINNTYACYDGEWIQIKQQGSSSYCTRSNEGEKYSYGNNYRYICHNYRWVPVDSIAYSLGLCTQDNLDSIGKRAKDSLSYQCRQLGTIYHWEKLTVEEETGIECTEELQDQTLKGQICDRNRWREQKWFESLYSWCTKTYIGLLAHTTNYTYRCESNGWEKITDDEFNTLECPEGTIDTPLLDEESTLSLSFRCHFGEIPPRASYY